MVYVGKQHIAKPFPMLNPFNFFLIGIGNSEEVKPIAPFSKDPQEAVYKPFINYEDGKVIEGIEHWKRLSDVLLSYIDHKESKLNGDVGALERKRLTIDGLVYIGKEASNLERIGFVDKPDYSKYQSKEDLLKTLESISYEEAKKRGIPRRTYYWLRRIAKEGKTTKLRQKTKKRLGNN